MNDGPDTSLFTLIKQDIIRQEFAHISSIYFNSAYFGPSPLRTKSFVENALQRELDPSFYPYNDWMDIPERLRKKIAHFVNCSEDRIFHSTSVSDIVTILANNLPFKSSDIVCLVKGDYPSNVLPWMVAEKNKKIKTHFLERSDLHHDILKKKVPSGTKILNLSHVAFDSGDRIALDEVIAFCQEREIFLVLDVTQSLGGITFTQEQIQHIDVLACSCYKWMLGPYGSAFAVLSDRALESIRHHQGNWIASINSKNVYSLVDYTTETLPGARKFDRGQTPNMLVMAALEASLDLLNELGGTYIEQHNAEIRDYFLAHFPQDKFKLMTPPHMGNILSLTGLSKSPQQLENDLKNQNVDVSVREGKIRLSFHLFNTIGQVDQLLKVLSS